MMKDIFGRCQNEHLSVIHTLISALPNTTLRLAQELAASLGNKPLNTRIGVPCPFHGAMDFGNHLVKGVIEAAEL